MVSVLEEFDATSPLLKAIDGVLHGIAIEGTDIIAEWQRRVSAYPDGLARATVEAHLRFFPIWRFADRLAARDTTLWYYQILVETCQNLVGVLAGLNHLYYAKFQFKRMHAFVGQMAIAPDSLSDRIDRLFACPMNSAVADLERLVGETVSLVEIHMPDIDTTPIRRELGVRDKPWLSTWNGTG